MNGKPIAHWRANQTLPPAQFDPDLDGQTSTRFTAQNVSLKPGDTLTLFGIPGLRNRVNTQQALDAHSKPHRDDGEFAPVDYIQSGPAGSLTPQN